MTKIPQADVLIVTVNRFESRAVLNAFQAALGQKARPVRIGGKVYRDLGTVNGARVFLALSEMGTTGPGASMQAVTKGIAALQPAAVIMVGIAFGVNDTKQALGDILVSRQLMLYELQRVGAQQLLPRGDRVHASTWLIDYLSSAELDWSGPPVRIGLILTGEKLVDNLDYREQLKKLEVEAIGGEMEGAGLYVACQDAKVDWVLIKAICDWADGNKLQDKDARQQQAAKNAAEFVVHALRHVPLQSLGSTRQSLQAQAASAIVAQRQVIGTLNITGSGNSVILHQSRGSEPQPEVPRLIQDRAPMEIEAQVGQRIDEVGNYAGGGAASSAGEFTSDPNPLMDAALSAYRVSIARCHQSMPLADLAVEAARRESFRNPDRLSMFVPVSLRKYRAHQSDQVRSEHGEHQTPLSTAEQEPIASGSSKENHSRAFAQALQDSVHAFTDVLANASETLLLILGGPGAGKTELTEWIRLKLCKAGESLPGVCAGTLPVRLELRHCEESGTTGEHDILTLAAKQVQTHYQVYIQPGQLRALARSGQLLLLLDGMDEIRSQRLRKLYAEQIVALHERYRSSRIIVTSRSASRQMLVSVLTDCAVYEIEPMSNVQIEEFVTKWHENALPTQAKINERNRKRLLAELIRNSSLRELARSPLLLTFLCLLNGRSELPDRRQQVFHRIIELIVNRWEITKELNDNSPSSLLNQEQKMVYLRLLAWEMQLESWQGSRGNVIPEEDLSHFTQSFCQSQLGLKEEISESTAPTIIRHMEERSSVIRYIGNGCYGFVHKVFLEQLAAEKANFSLEADCLSSLYATHWKDEDWQEVLYLCAGRLAEAGKAKALIQSLQCCFLTLPCTTIGLPDRLRAYSFSLNCLAEVPDAKLSPLRKFLDDLQQLIIEDLTRQNYDYMDTVDRAFILALQRFGARWPDQQSWLRWAEAWAHHGFPATLALGCLLTVVVPKNRLELLLPLLPKLDFHHKGSALWQVVARHAPWTRQELEILKAGFRLHSRNEFLVNAACSADAAAAGWLLEQLLLTGQEEARLSAELLKHADKGTSSAARAKLMDLVATPGSDSSTRAIAIEALMEQPVADPQLFALLRRLLSDPEPIVRMGAAYALIGTDAEVEAIAALRLGGPLGESALAILGRLSSIDIQASRDFLLKSILHYHIDSSISHSDFYYELAMQIISPLWDDSLTDHILNAKEHVDSWLLSLIFDQISNEKKRAQILNKISDHQIRVNFEKLCCRINRKKNSTTALTSELREFAYNRLIAEQNESWAGILWLELNDERGAEYLRKIAERNVFAFKIISTNEQLRDRLVKKDDDIFDGDLVGHRNDSILDSYLARAENDEVRLAWAQDIFRNASKEHVRYMAAEIVATKGNDPSARAEARAELAAIETKSLNAVRRLYIAGLLERADILLLMEDANYRPSDSVDMGWVSGEASWILRMLHRRAQLLNTRLGEIRG